MRRVMRASLPAVLAPLRYSPENVALFVSLQSISDVTSRGMLRVVAPNGHDLCDEKLLTNDAHECAHECE